MPILIHRTYSEVTPESAEHGDTSDSGFIIEDEPCTFRELVEYMETHSEASNGRPTGDIFEWYSTGYYVEDYSTGTEREECLHYSKANPSRMEKYWRLAAIAAGIVKV